MSRASLDIQVDAICAAEKITQDDLATSLNVSRPTISQWKSGKQNPRKDVADALYNRYLEAVEKLSSDFPLRRIERMRQEMVNAIGMMNPATIEAMHTQICRLGARDAAVKWGLLEEPVEVVETGSRSAAKGSGRNGAARD